MCNCWCRSKVSLVAVLSLIGILRGQVPTRVGDATWTPPASVDSLPTIAGLPDIFTPGKRPTGEDEG